MLEQTCAASHQKNPTHEGLWFMTFNKYTREKNAFPTLDFENAFAIFQI